MNRIMQPLSYGVMAMLLTACAQQPTQVNIEPFNARSAIAAERVNTMAETPNSAPVESPLALTEELLSLNSSLDTVDKKIDVQFSNRPAREFFAALAEDQGINILVDPLIDENISLSLKNVTMQQVTTALRDIYGFEFEKTSYGYRVSPNQLATRVYKLNYLNLERSGSSKTVVGGDDTNTVTTTFATSADQSAGFWGGIKTSILGFIKSNSNLEPVIINTQTGLLVVHATTNEHAEIARFLEDAELIMQKQVIIEAKIVEVTLDNEFRSGINWSFFNDSFGSNQTSAGFGLQGDPLSGIGDAGGVFNLNLTLDNFASMLQLLDHQGDVQVLSSPRVSTVNNQKAVIKVGSDEYFATSSGASASDDEEGNNASSITLEKFFSGIALDVTPQIADDEYVTLHVRPTVTEVVEKTKVITINKESISLPLAYSNIRESDSIIRAKSGQIVVIGGLLSQKQSQASTGLPWVGKVPGLRTLFAQDRDAQQKSELVILLKPTVYDDLTSMREVDSILERLE